MAKLFRMGYYYGYTSDDGLTWTTMAGMPNGMTPGEDYVNKSNLVYHNGVLYNFYGINSLGSMSRFKSTDNGSTWSYLGYYNIDLVNLLGHKTVLFNNKIYTICGAEDDYSRISSGVYCYDPATNTTTKPSSINGTTGFFNHGACVHNNEIWVIGGETKSSVMNSIFKSADGVTWTQVTPDIADVSNRTQADIVSFNGEIVVMGGRSGSGGLLKNAYASSDGVTWRSVTPPPPIANGNSYYLFDHNNNLVKIGEYLIYYSRYNASGVEQSNVQAYYTKDLVTWNVAPTNLDVGDYLGYTADTSATITLPAGTTIPTTIDLGTIALSSISTVSVTTTLGASIATIDLNIILSSASTVSAAVDLIDNNVYLNSINLSSGSSVTFTATVVTLQAYTIKGNVKIGNTFIANAKIVVISDSSNVAVSTVTDSNGNYQINVDSSGEYHVVCFYKDSNNNVYSSLVQPFVNVL